MRLIVIIVCYLHASMSWGMSQHLDWDKAIDQAISRYGLHTEPQLQQFFKRQHMAYPPKSVALLAFKQERKVELWAKDTSSSSWKWVHNYPLTAFSGHLGPKLKVGDRQIPEGVYRLISFNPYSSMHLSMMINYPNQFDRLHARQEGRHELGGDIFIHGKSISVGCLAVGDQGIDQLFLLARRVGLAHMQVIIAPNDLRKHRPSTISFNQPHWLPELYAQLTSVLAEFKTQAYS